MSSVCSYSNTSESEQSQSQQLVSSQLVSPTDAGFSDTQASMIPQQGSQLDKIEKAKAPPTATANIAIKKRIRARELGIGARISGTNPRAKGTNPRATGLNPRAQKRRIIEEKSNEMSYPIQKKIKNA